MARALRCLEAAFALYFVSHIPITLLLDLQALLPAGLHPQQVRAGRAPRVPPGVADPAVRSPCVEGRWREGALNKMTLNGGAPCFESARSLGVRVDAAVGRGRGARGRSCRCGAPSGGRRGAVPRMERRVPGGSLRVSGGPRSEWNRRARGRLA